MVGGREKTKEGEIKCGTRKKYYVVGERGIKVVVLGRGKIKW